MAFLHAFVPHDREARTPLFLRKKKQGQKTCSPLYSSRSCVLLCSRCYFLSVSREKETWRRTGGLLTFFLRCSWPPLFLWEETEERKFFFYSFPRFHVSLVAFRLCHPFLLPPLSHLLWLYSQRMPSTLKRLPPFTPATAPAKKMNSTPSNDVVLVCEVAICVLAHEVSKIL